MGAPGGAKHVYRGELDVTSIFVGNLKIDKSMENSYISTKTV